jgi:hypothetical protein
VGFFELLPQVRHEHFVYSTDDLTANKRQHEATQQEIHRASKKVSNLEKKKTKI